MAHLQSRGGHRAAEGGASRDSRRTACPAAIHFWECCVPVRQNADIASPGPSPREKSRWNIMRILFLFFWMPYLPRDEPSHLNWRFIKGNITWAGNSRIWSSLSLLETIFIIKLHVQIQSYMLLKEPYIRIPSSYIDFHAEKCLQHKENLHLKSYYMLYKYYMCNHLIKCGFYLIQQRDSPSNIYNKLFCWLKWDVECHIHWQNFSICHHKV